MEVVMPKMGESVSEGTIIKWHKKEGDKVERDEIIFEISTDKVDTEIPSPADGVLQQIKVPEGDTVEVGTVVAIISENGESAGTAAPAKEEAPREVAVTENKTETKKQEEEEIREETETRNLRFRKIPRHLQEIPVKLSISRCQRWVSQLWKVLY